jgi:hypothetical protein
MKYAIIGSGKIGTALARAFARNNIQSAIANSRGSETLASLAEKLGPSVVPQSVTYASGAEVIFLAVPFPAHKGVAKILKNWNGKIIVDAMNILNLSPKEREEMGGVLSSEVVAEAFGGARVVKGFNHLPAEQLGANPSIQGGNGRPCSYRVMMPMPARPSRPWRPSLASHQSNSESSMRVARPCMSWAGSQAAFCFRIWSSSADKNARSSDTSCSMNASSLSIPDGERPFWRSA